MNDLFPAHLGSPLRAVILKCNWREKGGGVVEEWWCYVF